MPLFGHNNAGQTTNATGGHNVLHKDDPALYNNAGTEHTAHHGHTGPGPAIGAAAGGAAGHHEGHTAVGTALGAAAGHHHAKTHPDHVAAPGVTSGVNAPAGAQHTGAQGYPAATHQAGSTAGAGEKAFVGKLEHAAGTVLCSSTLKAKGIEKEREAQALKMQSAELSAAERLEAEGAARRERAVGHGAHPQHLNAGHHAGGAPVGDTYGGGVPHTGPASGAPNVNNLNAAGGVGQQGMGGLR